METLSANETVKIPIAVLKVGESRVVQPELEFPYGPVTFTLVEGNGPVYIHGQQGSATVYFSFSTFDSSHIRLKLLTFRELFSIFSTKWLRRPSHRRWRRF